MQYGRDNANQAVRCCLKDDGTAPVCYILLHVSGPSYSRELEVK